MQIVRQKDEIDRLLYNLHRGLQHYTLKEFNQFLISLINKKNDKNLEINYIFEIVTNRFGITTTGLKRGAGKNFKQAKQISYCLMHFDLGLSIRHISKNIFLNSSSSVQFGVTRLKKAKLTNSDKAFLSAYESLQEKLIYFINQNQK